MRINKEGDLQTTRIAQLFGNFKIVIFEQDTENRYNANVRLELYAIGKIRKIDIGIEISASSKPC